MYLMHTICMYVYRFLKTTRTIHVATHLIHAFFFCFLVTDRKGSVDVP